MAWRRTIQSNGPMPPAQLQALALALRADLGITFGGMVAAVYTGPAGKPSFSFSGTPSASVETFDVRTHTPGARGVATVDVYINGVLSVGNVLTTAATLGPYDGVTLNLGNDAAYAAGNRWTSVPSVALWADALGNSYGQATQSKQPAWLAGGHSVMGFPDPPGLQASVLFDGVTQELLGAMPLVLQSAVEFSFMAIVEMVTGVPTPVIFGDASNFYLYCENADEWVASLAGTGAAALVSDLGDFKLPFLLTGVAASTQYEFPMGSPSASSGPVTLNSLLSLGSFSGGDYTNAMLSEVVFTTNVMPQSDRNGVRTYFNSRYGVPT